MDRSRNITSQPLLEPQTLLGQISSPIHNTIILLFDETGTYQHIWADPDFAKRSRFRIQDRLGRSVFEPKQADAFSHPKQAQSLATTIRTVLETGQSHSEIYPIETAYGVIWHDSVFSRLNNRQPYQVLGIIRDLTEMQEALDKATNDLETYRGVVEQAQDCIIVHRNGLLVYANPAAAAFFGLPSKHDLLGRNILELIHPDSIQDAQQRRILLENADKVPDLEFTFIGANGAIYGEVSSKAIQFAGQQAVLSVIRDNTAKKADKQFLQELERKLQQTQKLEGLQSLAGGVAHDFNNLLLGMLGNADLLRAELPPDSPFQPVVKRILTAANQAAELTRQLMVYTGGGHIDPKPTDLGKLACEMVDLMQATISKKITLDLKVPNETLPIHADASQMRQLIMNLLLNAAEAIGDACGLISISINRIHQPAACMHQTKRTYLELSIADNGCGMDTQTKSRIFDPFFSTKYPGRGLGLASVVGIIQRHKGSLQVDSRPEQGSLFRIQLPMIDNLKEQTQAKTVALPDTKVTNQKRKGTILVADDEEHVRIITKDMLEYGGYQVFLVEDGKAAIEIFSQKPNRFDAVLLDMTMPQKDGIETLREIRKIRAETPVILSTGHSQVDKSVTMELGIQGFLHKPYRIYELLEKIDLACSSHQVQPT